MVQEGVISMGIIFLLLGFIVSVIAYYTHISFLYFFSASVLFLGIVWLFTTMFYALKKESKSVMLSLLLLVTTLAIYGYQRFWFHHFDLFISDASDYYLAGINEVIHGGDLGFFLPLTASIAAVGFVLFGQTYAAVIMVLLYSATIPILYLLLRKFSFSLWVSLAMVLLFLSLPLDIWFSKSMFSEPIWQLELLIFIFLATQLLQNKTPNKIALLGLYLLMIVAPFTRGEASLLYGLVFFVSLYHYWRYQQLNVALLILSSIVALTLSIHYTLGLRPTYLLTWQYARLIPHVSETLLMGILYSLSALMIVVVFVLHQFKNVFSSFRFPLWSTLFLLFLKVSVAYLYSIKKAALAHTLLFKHALGFGHFLLLNELSFALENFGLPLTILIVFGLVLLYVQAFQGERNALLILVFYTLLTLPFVMQSVHPKDVNEMFLYWGRYYFSALMLVHFLALALLLQKIQQRISIYFPSIKQSALSFVLTGTVFILFASTSTLYTIVTKESHLAHSHKLIPWIKEHIHHAPLTILYDSTIHYDLHHNRSYDFRELTYRSFPMSGIKVATYQKSPPDKLNKTLTQMQQHQSSYLLCVAQKPCLLDTARFKVLGSISLPISWREHYGVHKEDVNHHHNRLEASVVRHLNLEATLYAIKEQFDYNKEILLRHDSAFSKNLLSKGWYMPQDRQGAWSKTNHLQLNIPHLQKSSQTHSRIALKYLLFNASKKHPKTMTLLAKGHVLKKVTLYKTMLKTLTFQIPNSLLDKNQDSLLVDMVVSDNTEKAKRHGVYLRSITIYQ